jgi:hypothetical protein
MHASIVGATLFIVAFAAIGVRAQSSTTVAPSVADRAIELRKELAKGPNERQSRQAVDETTVQALISIIEQESKPEGDHKLVTAGIHELGNFPQNARAIRFLVQMIEYERSARANNFPLLRFTAAQSLIRIGGQARKALLSVGVPLSEQNLQLRAHVLASIEEIEPDNESGRAIAISRLLRELERRNVIPVEQDAEEQRQIAISNVRRMIALLTDPSFMSRQIPHTPAPR